MSSRHNNIAKEVYSTEDSSMVVAEEQLARFNDLIFPRRCVVCDCEIDPSVPLLVCDSCQFKMSRGNQPVCHRCGATKIPARATVGAVDCPKCRDVKFYFDSALSLGDYENELRQVVIEMKHPGRESLTIQIGRWLGQSFREAVAALGIDILVAMPSYWTRHFSRGANVSALLCDGLSIAVNLDVQTRLLKQTRATRKQGTLTRTQRQINVKNAFKMRSGFCVEGCNVLLVDDVMSSCATMNEASRIIKEAGSNSVHALVVARGKGSF